MFDFHGKTGLITSSGIGAATAQLFYQADAPLVLTDLSESMLEPSVRPLESQVASTHRAMALPLGTSDPSAWVSASGQGSARFCGLDCVIHCAGICIALLGGADSG